MLESFLSYEEVYNKWLKQGRTFESALSLTKDQLNSLEKIVSNDNGWAQLIAIASKGRTQDAWLAADWPAGFDELTVCVPLCKLVDWECAICTVGKRQNNFSCAHDYSLFGYIGTLVERGDRTGLLTHIDKIRTLLNDTTGTLNWDVANFELVKISTSR